MSDTYLRDAVQQLAESASDLAKAVHDLQQLSGIDGAPHALQMGVKRAHHAATIIANALSNGEGLP